jgi:hypothetical protein
MGVGITPLPFQFMHTSKITSVLAALALVGGAAGCATTTAPKASGAVADSEYEMVTPIGSNIPVRVRKGSTAETSSPSATISGDAARQMISPGGANGQARSDGK